MVIYIGNIVGGRSCINTNNFVFIIRLKSVFYSLAGLLRGRRFESTRSGATFVFMSSDVVWFIHIHSQHPCGGGLHSLAKVGGLCQSTCEYSELRSGPKLTLIHRRSGHRENRWNHRTAAALSGRPVAIKNKFTCKITSTSHLAKTGFTGFTP